jgi:hypothetical protein
MGNDLISAAGLIKIIDESRQNALKKVNEELIYGRKTHRNEKFRR